MGHHFFFRSRLNSNVIFGTGGGDKGSWIVDPDANNQTGVVKKKTSEMV